MTNKKGNLQGKRLPEESRGPGRESRRAEMLKRFEQLDREKVKTLEDVIETLSTQCNSSLYDAEKAADVLSRKFCRCHRTLQQSMIRTLSIMIRKVADQPTDLRNEAAIAWCRKVSQIEDYFPYV